MRVLLIEDDPMIAAAVDTALRQEGYAVDRVEDGNAASAALAATRFDVVLLDLGLPGRDGLQVLRELRARHDRTAVIIVTARDDVAVRIAGLDAGADDYLVKPFDIDELAARMRAVLRRRAGAAGGVLECHGIRLDPATHEVSLDGQPIELSAREYAVLEALMLRPGAVLSRTQIEDRLYGWGGQIASNAVEVYVHGLRRKLGHDVIRTVRGIGYCVAK